MDLNVRYVNSMEAMQISKQGAEVAKQLEAKRLSLAKEIKNLEQSITQAMTDYKSKEATMSTKLVM